MINFFDNDMREIWASRDSGSTFPISRVYFEDIQIWPEGEPPVPPTPTGYTFSVFPTALTTDDSAKTVYFIITTNSPQWLVNPSQSWITVNGITGGTLEVSIAANSGSTDRQGALAFSYRKSSTGGTGYVTVDVTQEGAVPVLNYNVQYTSTDKAIVTPAVSVPFAGESILSGVSILSNTYYPDDDYGEIVVDSEIYDFKDNAFRECTTLSSIVIPDTTRWLGNYVFYGCTNLSSIILPSELAMICDYAFQNCTSLTSIVIPDTAGFLNGFSTFRGCTSLSSVTFGSSVTKIGSSMFRGCTSLSSITISGGSITLIGGSAFRDCTALSSVTISDTVKGIGDAAFYGCSALSNITIPDSVTNIGGSAFYGCSALSSVTFGSGITYINSEAFRYCTSLSSIVIPSGVTSIRQYTFADCTSLSSVTIPDGVTSIGDYVFQNCTSLSSITYTGTMAQWAQVTKGTYWRRRVPATVVHCTDGDTPI